MNIGKNDLSLGFNANTLPENLPFVNLNKGGGIPRFPNFAAWTPNLKTILLQENNITKIPAAHIRNMNITWLNIRMNRLVSVPEYKIYPHIKNWF